MTPERPETLLALTVSARRIHAGLTRSGLARKLGVRTSSVRQAEAGRKTVAKAALPRLRQFGGWDQIIAWREGMQADG